MVVLDLDRLKEINDTYGHEAGDRALRAIGSVLKCTVRQNDLCARFAGDEFVVVLWDCSPENEARRVRSCRRRSALIHSNRVRASACAVDRAGRPASPSTARPSRNCWRTGRRADVSRQGRPAVENSSRQAAGSSEEGALSERPDLRPRGPGRG